MSDARRDSTAGPLREMLVIALSRSLAGPHVTMMLGDLGAHRQARNPRLVVLSITGLQRGQ